MSVNEINCVIYFNVQIYFEKLYIQVFLSDNREKRDIDKYTVNRVQTVNPINFNDVEIRGIVK